MDSTTADEAAADRDAVTRLFAVAGVTMADSELERMVRVYPQLRAQADALYAAEFAGVDFGLAFDPTIGFN